MTDTQQEQAINRVLDATERQLQAVEQQLSVLRAHLDLLRSLNNAPEGPTPTSS